MPFRQFLKIAATVAAATVGTGVFALPYVVAHAGWALALFYFILFTVLIAAAHTVYFRTLEAEGEKERLLGLAGKYFGRAGFWIGFAVIVIGLLLGVAALLIIGPRFVELIFPALPSAAAFILFWCVIAFMVFMGDGAVIHFEELGIASVFAVVLFVFATGHPARALAVIPPVDTRSLFLPIGAVLFSLAGWTGVEGVYYGIRGTPAARGRLWPAFAAGTFFAVVLYFLFAFGIAGAAPHITSDTVSGLVTWPLWKKDIVAVVGLLAALTIAMPITHELRNTIEKDMRQRPVFARFAIVLVPLAAVFLGANNFLSVVSIVGGFFLSTQYLLIIAVGARSLVFSRPQKVLLACAAAVFVSAAAYSVYGFLK